MGPVAEAVERAGGSLARVFRRAELPLRLIERPEQLILLRDQLALVEYAAREIDDPELPLRLSLTAGFRSLGVFGARVGEAASLGEAIAVCNAGIGALLQSATHMQLVVGPRIIRWTYRISDNATVGRQKNELLAIGYMTDLLRCFTRSAAPLRIELPATPQERSRLKGLLGCDVAAGETAALVFPAEWLEAANPAPRPARALDATEAVPKDFPAGVEELVRLALLERRPTIDWVGRRLRLGPRTLQRRLAAEGDSFEAVRRRVLAAEAAVLLRDSALPVSAIALELGYADPAHFSRAALGWVGLSPRAWRRSLRTAQACVGGPEVLGNTSMTEEKERKTGEQPGAGGASGKKNAKALAAALRANLQRRKARERALREKPDAATSDATDEATWTK